MGQPRPLTAPCVGDVAIAEGRGALRRLVAAACLAAGILGVLALIGWATGTMILAAVRSDFIPMAPNTAVTFMVLSVALLAPGHRVSLRRGVAVLVAAVALHALITGYDPDRVGRLGPFPLGIMSPVTAVTFLAASASLFTLSLPGRMEVSAPLSLFVACVGFVCVLGYVYGTPLLYQGSVIPLALTTAVAFACTGVGLLAQAGTAVWPANRFTGTSVRVRMQRAFIPTVIVVALAHGWLAIVVASGPFRNPALLAAALATASIPIAAYVVARLSGRIGTVIECAEQRRVEAEERRARLEERERSATAMARQKEELARLVVHDLKSPLTTIVMGTELLRSRVKADPRATELAADVLEAALLMDRMTLDILDISGSEDGALVPRLECIDLAHLLASVARSFRLRASQRGVDVVVDSSLADPHVEADLHLLQRVLENLLDNCLKYGPSGLPIRVEVRAVAPGAVEVAVCDEGHADRRSYAPHATDA